MVCFFKVLVPTQTISCPESVFLRRERGRSREQSQERSWGELAGAEIKAQEGEMVQSKLYSSFANPVPTTTPFLLLKVYSSKHGCSRWRCLRNDMEHCRLALPRSKQVFFFCNWELPHLMAINLIKTRFLFCFKHEGLAWFCFVLFLMFWVVNTTTE